MDSEQQVENVGGSIKIGSNVYSRGEISRGTGLSLSHVSRVFSGARKPSLTTLKRLAAYLGVNIDVVVGSIRTTHQ